MSEYAVLATVADQPGILHGLTKVLAAYDANISYVDIVRPADRNPQVYLEFAFEGAIDSVVSDMRAVPGVKTVDLPPLFAKIYGKRIVIMAGSVPDAADLVVSDPVQAGVMAVMGVADTAKFDLVRQEKRRY